MRATSITIGIPVSDLQAARRWYEKVLDVSEPDLEPVADIVEYGCGRSGQSHCRDLLAHSRLGRRLIVVVCLT